MPLNIALEAPYARVDPILYVPIALHPCGLGWHPEWTKVWQGWGPAYEPEWAPTERMEAIKERARVYRKEQEALRAVEDQGKIQNIGVKKAEV